MGLSTGGRAGPGRVQADRLGGSKLIAAFSRNPPISPKATIRAMCPTTPKMVIQRLVVGPSSRFVLVQELPADALQDLVRAIAMKSRPTAATISCPPGHPSTRQPACAGCSNSGSRAQQDRTASVHMAAYAPPLPAAATRPNVLWSPPPGAVAHEDLHEPPARVAAQPDRDRDQRSAPTAGAGSSPSPHADRSAAWPRASRPGSRAGRWPRDHACARRNLSRVRPQTRRYGSPA